MKTGRFGKFEIERELGRGAMGHVYKARDQLLDRHVALKTISPSLLGSEENRKRFQREAKSAARLQHPNIVTIYEVGELEGTLYIAMELVEGLELGEALTPPGRLSLDQRVRMVVDVCRGLDFAHKKGVVHRDVKPANVRLTREGTVKILDFGIAKSLPGTDVTDANLTQQGVIIGTPHYLSPERIRGEEDSCHDDMWAVGVMLFEALTGRRPFEAPTIASLIYKIVNEPLPPIDAETLHLPERLVAVAARALDKDRERRFPDLGTMANALSSAIEANPTPEAPLSPVAIPQRSPAATTVPTPPADAATTPAFATPPGPRDTATLRAMGAGAFREVGSFGEPPATKQAVLSPAADILAVAGADGALRLWDLRARNRANVLRTDLHRRTGHDAAALCLAFSPDGSLLASAHVDGVVHLWDTAKAEEVPVRLRHDQPAGALAFSPDAATLASGSIDSTLRLWDVGAALAGEARRELVRQPAAVTAVAWAGGGEWVLTGHSSRILRLLDPRRLRLLATLRGPEGPVNLLVPSPDGRLMAVASQDRTVRLFDLASREQSTVLTGLRRPASSLCFLADGAYLATVSQENSVQLWDLQTGSPAATLWGPADESFVAVALFGESNHLAVALGDGRIRVWAPAG